MPDSTLSDLYLDQLRDLHDAEAQLAEALPEVAARASHPELRMLFLLHREETLEHRRRLDRLFDTLCVCPDGPPCDAIAHLLSAAFLHDHPDGTERDAALIRTVRHIECYEMRAYENAAFFATLLDAPQASDLLQQTMAEEHRAYRILTRLLNAETSA